MLGVLKELWAYRELAIVLAWRELVVRYKRSVLGVVWALAEPLMMVGVYVVVFGFFLDAGGDAVENYGLFALLGVLAWTYLSSTLERASTSFIDHTPFYKKVYFPRELFIVAVLVSRLTTLLAGLAVAGAAIAIIPSWRAQAALERLVWIPVGVVAMTLVCFGLGLLLAALNAIFRDTNFIVRFALRLLFYACPVVYPLARVPASMREAYELNPAVSLLWTFQGVADRRLAAPDAPSVLAAALFCLVVGFGGWWAFRKLQWRVADLL